MTTYLVALDDSGWKDGFPPGDNARIWFLFTATPEEKKPLEKDLRQTFKVELSISEDLLACGGWKELESRPEDIELQAYAYVRENLEKQGLPSEKSMPLSLATFTENGRFAKGPVYDPKKINKNRPFKVCEKTSPIGFKKPKE